MLAFVLRGTALDKVRNAVEKRNGLMIWRALYEGYEPQVKARYGGMLAEVLATKVKGASLGEFDAFETAMRLYTSQSNEEIAESVKIATVLNGLQNARLLEHLQLNQDKFTKFSELKVFVQNYFTAKKVWIDGVALGADCAGAARGWQTRRMCSPGP